LEQLFQSRLQPHILTSPNFNPDQAAYRHNHSTATAVLCTLDNVYHSANAHKSTILVSLDLSAAFGTINHFILSNTLHSTFGISGAALQWIIILPHNLATLRLIINYLHLGFLNALSLAFFFSPLYVSPIASLLSHLGAKQHQYADNTQLFISFSQSSATAEIHTFVSALADLPQWFSLNCLTLNTTKYSAILLGTYQRNCTLSNISHINVIGSIVPLSASLYLYLSPLASL